MKGHSDFVPFDATRTPLKATQQNHQAPQYGGVGVGEITRNLIDMKPAEMTSDK